jgi:uncharacterized membrane protein YeaQ/YmgE (transglycosylase-associated protein family)
MYLSVIAWIVLGGLAGMIASKIVNGAGEGMLMDIVLGIIGGLVGGALFQALGFAPAVGFFNPYTWLVAIVGSLIVVFIYRKLIT